MKIARSVNLIGRLLFSRRAISLFIFRGTSSDPVVPLSRIDDPVVYSYQSDHTDIAVACAGNRDEQHVTPHQRRKMNAQRSDRR